MERMRRLVSRFERPLLLAGVVAVFAVTYFGAAALPPWHARATLAWDPVRFVPFVPAFIVPYLSVFLMPLPLFSKAIDQASFRRLAAAFVVVILVSGAFFLALPLAPPHAADPGDGVFAGLTAFVYGVDAPTNLFPSLHVSVSFLCAFAMARFMPRLRLPAVLWACLIAASTMFVRQHYAADVAGGIALACAAWRAAFPRPRGR